MRVECRGELALVSNLLDRVFVFFCSGHVVYPCTPCFSVPFHCIRGAILMLSI